MCMNTPTKHTVKSYDAELQKLRDLIIRMASLSETQYLNAFKALRDRDEDLAREIIKNDLQINDLERELYEFAVKMLALRQPMGQDLRNIIAALKISSDVERIGDYASNAAVRVLKLMKSDPQDLLEDVIGLGEKAIIMFKESIRAFNEKDVERAKAVWISDEKIDEDYNIVYKKLMKHMEAHPDEINACTHLIFVAKNIERMGDHTQNIAEIIYYSLEGETLNPDNIDFDAVDIQIF